MLMGLYEFWEYDAAALLLTSGVTWVPAQITIALFFKNKRSSVKVIVFTVNS